MKEIIAMSHVVQTFGSKTALSDINLSVEQGEIFGLLGPSGAGKTTLIKIATGQLAPTSGEAYTLGEPCTALTHSIFEKMGIVMDNSGLYERLSCYDNLVLYTRIYGLDKKRIDEVLELTNLSEARKKTAGTLSKGMKQRLVLARAVLNKPKLLFLDEPTSGLDPATSIKIHDLLLDLKNHGATIFLTTHNMEEASKLCSHVALLNDGTIIEYGSPDAICRKHNEENKITILCRDHTIKTIPNSPASAEEIHGYFKDNNVISIHSSEPNLETVFIALTGRRLV